MSRPASDRPETIDPRDVRSVLGAIIDGKFRGDQVQVLLNAHAAASPDRGMALAVTLAFEVQDREKRLGDLAGIVDEMGKHLETLREAPWLPARVVDTWDLERSGHILVCWGTTQRLVVLGENVDARGVQSGDMVYLNNSANAVMATIAPDRGIGSETAMFDGEMPDGRLSVRIRDEEVLLHRGRDLVDRVLQRGMLLRIDRTAQLALECLRDGAEGSARFVAPDAEPVAVGGARVKQAVDRIVESLAARLVDPARALRFGLGSRRTVLLSGPPGVGKTRSMRAATQRLQEMTGRRCRLAIVRPGEFESPWVGSTEANIRATFARLALEAGDDLVVLFLDEIEAIGRVRGGAMSRYSDKFLAALLVEIDGLVDRGNIAVVAATNRKDMLDPALIERLGEIDIEVPRPDLDAAREILAVHLPQDLPFAISVRRNAEATRRALIDTAVSLLYAPNADNRVATVHLRDGTTRSVETREMVSGRLLEQVARRIRESGFRRSTAGEEEALDLPDAREAVAEVLERLRSTVTAHNVRAWVEGLPSDIDIVRVTGQRPAVARAYRYLRAA
jgi:proteasome-associated ATPase